MLSGNSKGVSNRLVWFVVDYLNNFNGFMVFPRKFMGKILNAVLGI